VAANEIPRSKLRGIKPSLGLKSRRHPHCTAEKPGGYIVHSSEGPAGIRSFVHQD
jgi:hypothetical protein